MRSTRASAGLSAVALAAAGCGQQTTAPAPVPPAVALTTLTGPPPDARCRRGDRSVQGGADVEPYLAVDPSDPDRLLATWQQDRRTTGGAVGIAVAGSTDGGATWHAQRLPGGAPCHAGGLTGASDPWLAIGPDGAAYLADLPFAARGARRPHRALVAVNRAPAGLGGGWLPRTALSGGHSFDDKPSVTADPGRPGVAYAVWHRGDRTLLRRTVNGGATWSAPRAVRALAGTVGQVIAPLPGGRLLMTALAPGGRTAFVATTSDDRGATWSRRAVIGVRRRTVARRRGERPVRPGIFPAVAALPDGGVVALWAAARGRGSAILRAASRDGGRTWSASRIVLARRGAAVTPAAAVAADGTLGLTWTEIASRRRAAVVFASSRDAGRTWRTRRLVGPFDLRRAPRADGALFLGDYTGLVAVRGGFGALVAVVPPVARGGRADVIFARVRA